MIHYCLILSHIMQSTSIEIGVWVAMVSGLRYRANTKDCAFRAATPPWRRAAQAALPIKRRRAGSSFRGWCFANFSAALRSSGKNEGGDIDFAVYSIPSRAYQASRYGTECRRVEIGSHPSFFPSLYRPRKASPPLGIGLADVPRRRWMNAACHCLPTRRASDI